MPRTYSRVQGIVALRPDLIHSSLVSDPLRDVDRPWTHTAGAVLAVVLLLVAATLGATSSWGRIVEVLPYEAPTIEPGPLPQATELPPEIPLEDLKAPEPVEIPGWIADLVQAVVVAVLLGAAIWIIIAVARAVKAQRELRRARESSGTAVEILEIDEQEVVASLSQTLESLRAGIDVDDAVVECWRRLEKLADDTGIIRHHSQTSEEFTVDVLARTAASPRDLAALGSLYRRALFSTHVLTDADRQVAIDAVERLADALRATEPTPRFPEPVEGPDHA